MGVGAPLEAFPSDAKPLAAWPSQEQAFAQIEQWLRVTIEKQWLAYGNALIQDGMHFLDEEALAAHEEALVAYEEALRLNPALKEAWYGKAEVLIGLRRYEEMLEEERRWKPVLKRSGAGQGHVFMGPQLYEEALQASDEALRLDSAYFWAWSTKARALAGLKRCEEALLAYDEALRGLPTLAGIWHQKGKMLQALGRRREARQAQKAARQLGWRR